MEDVIRSRSKEASIPVQSRVNLVTLANLDHYWIKGGYDIRSMSQLVSWSLDLLMKVLVANKVSEERVQRVDEANVYLESRGLYQRSMKKAGIKKLINALSMESLRDEGTDPRFYVPQQHKIVHRKGTIETFEGEVETKKSTLDIVEEAIKKAREMNKKEREEKLKGVVQRPAMRGNMTNDEIDEYSRQREKEANEQLKQLNEIDELPFVEEDK